jgi:aspartate kinase
VHQAFGLDKPRPTAGAPASPGTPAGLRRRPAAVVEEAGSPRGLAAISQQLSRMEEIVVSDLLLTNDHGRVTIFDLGDPPDRCLKVFQAVAAGGILVDMIVQNVKGPGRVELSFSVPRQDLERAAKLTREAVQRLDPVARVVVDADIAKVFVLGVGMRTHTGVAQRMFGALAQRGINISMINTSEVRVSAVVDGQRGEEALACLKEAFPLGKE